MTDRDIHNTEYLKALLESPNKATAISSALEYTAELYRMLKATGDVLKIHHQDGSTEIITFEKRKKKG